VEEEEEDVKDKIEVDSILNPQKRRNGERKRERGCFVMPLSL
jgi:hypothetical protein